jgi:hypothetical protein
MKIIEMKNVFFENKNYRNEMFSLKNIEMKNENYIIEMKCFL